MKRRININIEDDKISDMEAIWFVMSVIKAGRISNSAGFDHYCHLSTSGKNRIRASKRSSTSDSFTLWKE